MITWASSRGQATWKSPPDRQRVASHPGITPVSLVATRMAQVSVPQARVWPLSRSKVR